MLPPSAECVALDEEFNTHFADAVVEFTFPTHPFDLVFGEVEAASVHQHHDADF